MPTNFNEIAERIKSLRELMDFTPEEMAQATDFTVEQYLRAESGSVDLSFTFLHKCASKLGVDIVELLTGEAPRLASYTVTRAGEGLPFERRAGFTYRHLGFRLKNKFAEPFMVTAPFDPQAESDPIPLSTHEGQEFDYILEGSLRCVIDGKEELLRAGDSVYYDSGKPHGMVAADGAPCVFLAFVIKK